MCIGPGAAGYFRGSSNLSEQWLVIGLTTSFPPRYVNKLVSLLLLALGLGSGCQQSDTGPQATPEPLFRGQVVRYDLTYDAHGENPRVRWIVQLASPQRVQGWDGRDYTQVKVFSLADTTTFRPGVKFKFTYQLVPSSEQTAWATNYERSAVVAFPAGYLPNPELAITSVQLP
jgi:hypothetical protein